MKTRIRLNENFYMDEFVDPVTFFTAVDHGLSCIDIPLVNCVQFLRTKYGKSIGVNGWWKYLPEDMTGFDPIKFLNEMLKKKVPVWSGFRSALCKIGAKKSAHRKGKAGDPKGDEKAFFKIVCENAQEFYNMGLRRIENTEYTNGWLHMDTLETNHKVGFIRIINPSTGDDRTSNKHAGDIVVATGEVIMIDLLAA